MGMTEREGLGDGERPVRELRVGRGERQVDAVARERAQGEEAFEPRNPSAGDDHVRRADRTTWLREDRS
jgi:hypothetical protein